MKHIANIIKELRLFLVFVVSLVGTSMWNWEQALVYIYTFNIHLAILTIGGIYITHFLSSKRHRATEEVIANIVLDHHRSQLKADIKNVFELYNDYDKITDPTVIKYLLALDKKRKELKINSFTEEMMKIILDKITIK